MYGNSTKRVIHMQFLKQEPIRSKHDEGRDKSYKSRSDSTEFGTSCRYTDKSRDDTEAEDLNTDTLFEEQADQVGTKSAEGS